LHCRNKAPLDRGIIVALSQSLRDAVLAALALGYFLLNSLFGMALFGANFLGLNKYVVVTTIATWAVGLICAVHSYRLASGAEPTTLRKWYSRRYGIVGVAMTAFLCIFGFRAFLYEPFHVPSSSMLFHASSDTGGLDRVCVQMGFRSLRNLSVSESKHCKDLAR
jgi:hypothetical protein